MDLGAPILRQLGLLQHVCRVVDSYGHREDGRHGLAILVDLNLGREFEEIMAFYDLPLCAWQNLHRVILVDPIYQVDLELNGLVADLGLSWVQAG